MGRMPQHSVTKHLWALPCPDLVLLPTQPALIYMQGNENKALLGPEVWKYL